MRWIAIIFIFNLVGCTGFGGSTGQKFVNLEPVGENYGHIYLYRPSSFIMSLAYPTITIDGEPVESVRNGSYIIYEVAPGSYNFKIASNSFWAVKTIEKEIEVPEKSRKFLRVKAELEELELYGPVLAPSLSGHFWEVTEEFAKKELPLLKGKKYKHITSKGSG